MSSPSKSSNGTLSTWDEAAGRLGAKPADDRTLIQALEARGYVIRKDARPERQVKLPAPKRGKVRFGVVSDTHLGHVKQQLTYWRTFTADAARWGAEFILHGGDLVDGQNMHRDQQWELHRHGAYAQAKYAAEVMPKLERGGTVLPTYIIGGNHDGSAFVDAGANVLDTLQSKRPDVKFLGAPTATFHAGPVRIFLMHPDGGVSYARSYRQQKIIEQFAPDDKPHLLLTGHWHVTNHLPGYRNVEGFMLPCFQAQTAFLKRKGLAPQIGGLLVELEYSTRGLEDVTTKWVLYRTALESDY